MDKKKQKDENIYYCVGCGKTHSKHNFYMSFSPNHANGRLFYCKDYIKSLCYDEKENLDIEKFKEVLMQLDVGFLEDAFNTALEMEEETIGVYFRMINSFAHYKGRSWKESVFIEKETGDKPSEDKKEIIILEDINRELTNEEKVELVDKWGFGYEDMEYKLFEKRWYELIDNYGRKTSMHVEGLKTYIRFRIKEEMATAKGDIRTAKEWGAMAATAAKDGKINVAQLSASDISGGLDVLPQLFEAVESEVGIIPQLPKLLEQPYDDADMIIWCNINYMRRLEGKPRIEYREVWDFYDEMIEEYCKQKGLNKKQTEEFKKKRKVEYKNLGEIYKEPIYEEGDL